MKKIIKSVIPEYIKLKIIKNISKYMHLVPEYEKKQLFTYNSLLFKLVEKGITSRLEFDYNNMRDSSLNYIKSMQKGSQFEYFFSGTSTRPTLYSSVYALMIKGLYGEIDNMSESIKNEWEDYFNSFQSSDDGLFRDPVIQCEAFEKGDGWGGRHLLAHIIIAYARLGRIPKYKFYFLEKFYNDKELDHWLSNIDFSKSVWAASNKIMNYVVIMQFSRDYMNDNHADRAINKILKWLLMKQRAETGMWHDDKINDYGSLVDAIRGAYHFYPLFFYNKMDVPYKEKIVAHIMSSQNKMGGFDRDGCASGACEDIDAIDPLIRFNLLSGYKNNEVERSINKALVWVLANRNDDGGFVYRLNSSFSYGGHSEMSSDINESNMFATWFRTLSIAYMTNYLKINNNYSIGKYPGCELSLYD